MVVKKCLYCKKEFQTNDKRQKFCNRNCWSKSTRRFKICEICGKKYGGVNQGKRFCSSRCYGKYRIGRFTKSKIGTWKGGITYANGYRYIYKPNHPFSTHVGYIMEHRFVMEQKLGRYLDVKNEVVHHKDGNRLNNNINNLELQTRAQHINFHRESLTWARFYR